MKKSKKANISDKDKSRSANSKISKKGTSFVDSDKIKKVD